jgi:predicted small metal-binding protein
MPGLSIRSVPVRRVGVREPECRKVPAWGQARSTGRHSHDEGDLMAYSFACADTGADCPGAFATEGKDELMAHVQMHAQTAHPELAGNPDLASVVGGLVKQI